jgi:glycosyltransferase involved in cell wall biosynthesis
LTSTAHHPLSIFVVHASDCVTDYMPHGDGLVAEAFIRRLALRGHRIHVATESVALRRPMPPGVTLHPVPAPAIGHRLAFMVNVRRLLVALGRTTTFDLIHQFNPVFTGMSLAAVGLRTRVVLGPFVPFWPPEEGVSANSWLTTRARDWISKLQQRQASALLVTTPAALSRVKVVSTNGQPRIFEVPHGIDLDRFPARTSPPGVPSILFLANLWRRKGIFDLLGAFGAVRRILPEVRLTIAGRGSDEALVHAAVEEHPEREAITITGHIPREDVPALLRAHAVYCLPSIGEPFGMTLLEAMASGVPIVTSTSGGPGYLVDGRGGRLVPPRDQAGLARALLEILQSDELQRSMGVHNRMEAERRFAWDRVIDALEDAYYCTLNSRDVVAVERRPWSGAVHVSAPRPPS